MFFKKKFLIIFFCSTSVYCGDKKNPFSYSIFFKKNGTVGLKNSNGKIVKHFDVEGHLEQYAMEAFLRCNEEIEGMSFGQNQQRKNK